ncbi:hypothetical protein [Methanosarcina sp. UBA5]|uniref:hypothetical protein n=1 Tax=Methanosarcina sp. UBA5 TaxID=1915593 RepID=UPI0025DA19A4|nr:hypothetical protein [Methanosarcina sp. UBA5]
MLVEALHSRLDYRCFNRSYCRRFGDAAGLFPAHPIARNMIDKTMKIASSLLILSP